MKYRNRILALGFCCASTLPALGDDLLATDDFAFDTSEIEVSKPHWTDGFKTTLEHSHTQIPAEPNRAQSSVRLEYESNIADGWYAKLDTRYRYFWDKDDLAEARGDAYGRNKLQRAWLQYSRGACTATAGRQTLIWGTVEGTFVTDIVTPFDYTEQLLTDYGNVRLAQDMLVGECFVANAQIQAFYTPEAETDIFQHHPLSFTISPTVPAIHLDQDAKEEWGLRYKWQGVRYDISLMYAQLYDNTATPVINNNSGSTLNDDDANYLPEIIASLMNTGSLPPGISIEAELTKFDLVGVASTIAVGRLLLKAEAAFRDNQLLRFTTERTERYDAALGFEYTTSDNHIFNGGVWATHLKNDKLKQRDIQVITMGWRHSYLNDNLVMSVLGNWASNPRFATATILAEYQWSDYWSSAFALSLADLDESSKDLPVASAEKAATLSIKYEF